MEIKIDIDKPKKSPIQRAIFRRSMVLNYLFLFFGLLVIGRIIQLQYSEKGSELRAEAGSEKNFELRTLKAIRGAIKSHDGKILATTVPLYHLYMDFRAGGLDSAKFFNNVGDLSVSLADFYKDKSAASYRALLEDSYHKGLRYKRISPKRVNYIELKKLLTFPLLREGRHRGGWVLDTIQNRVLPYGQLATRTIGRINELGRGFGIEGALDSILAGTNGVSMFQKVSGTFWVPMEFHANRDAIDGLDVVSTLDAEVQHVAEEILREQLEKHNANWGTAVLMEVSTGEIRALANLGKVNDGSFADIYNYAIGQNMEPGSTFKIVSLLALLEDAGLTLDNTVDCGDGFAMIGSAKVRDTRRGGFGVLPLRRVFELSSNIGFAKLIHENYGHNPQSYIDFIEKKKLNKPFDFHIKGIASPRVNSPKNRTWSNSSLAMISYGYEVLMTPLQTLSIYNAIANNGTYIQPKIVKGFSRGDDIVELTPIDTINSALASEKNIKDIRHTLEQVVNDGTAKVLLNPYYRVAGKTGTAQVSKGRFGYHYNGGRNYLATMVGYFPADNPKYSCIVAIELFHRDGTSSPYYGGVVSGPVFRAIADKVYSQAVDWGNNLQRPTKFLKANNKNTRNTANTKSIMIKKGNDNSTEKLIEELQLSSLNMTEFTHTDSVMYADTSRTRELPNVKGMGLRDAVLILNKAGYKVKAKGSGMVVQQKLTTIDTNYNIIIDLVLK